MEWRHLRQSVEPLLHGIPAVCGGRILGGGIAICRAILLLVAIAVAVAGCGPAATQPAFTKEQAIKRATEDAKASAPEVGIQEARIDRVTAELITLGEADGRFGGERGPGGYSPGQDRNTPVWWVRVEGRFRYQGMIRPGTTGYGPHAYDLVEADERDFAYDARIGESVGSSIPGTRVIGTVVPSASSDSPEREQSPRTTDVPAPPGVRPTSTPVPTPTPAPSAIPQAGVDPRDALDRFMSARIHRQDAVVRGLLSDGLREALETGKVAAIRADLFQVSNPCWYRYEVESFGRPTSATAKAQVRIYQHVWGGDIAGGPPRSWEQDVSLVETSAGWRVDQVSEPRDNREELREPHGLTASACSGGAAAPTPSAEVMGRPSVGHLRLACYRRMDEHADPKGGGPVYIVDRDIEVRASVRGIKRLDVSLHVGGRD